MESTTASMSAIASAEIQRSFAAHVAVSERVLSTSAPLETALLGEALRLAADGLLRTPSLQQRAETIYHQLMRDQVITPADAMREMLELLQGHAEAAEFFMKCIVQVLTGQRLPSYARIFRRLGHPDAAPAEPPASEANQTTTNDHRAVTPATHSQPTSNDVDDEVKSRLSQPESEPKAHSAAPLVESNGASVVDARPSHPQMPSSIAARHDAHKEIAKEHHSTDKKPVKDIKWHLEELRRHEQSKVEAAARRKERRQQQSYASDTRVDHASDEHMEHPDDAHNNKQRSDSRRRERNTTARSSFESTANSICSLSSDSEDLPTPPAKHKRASRKVSYTESEPDEEVVGQRTNKRRFSVKSEPLMQDGGRKQKRRKLKAPATTQQMLSNVPPPWAQPRYQRVEIINVADADAFARVCQLRVAGTPFLLEGHQGYAQFADTWVSADGTLDTEAFMRGIHDVKVPVLEHQYDDVQPITTHVPLVHFVRNYWDKGSSEYYLHQWQFPLSFRAGRLLCYKSAELPVLGDNLLHYWLDAVRGDNPLQYLFMGQPSTRSRMHKDSGGLAITIAPIVGTKRVTMLHRDAARLETVHSHVDWDVLDLDRIPKLAFLPAWQVDVHPGQVLFMPDGTLHACENLTPCLSYHCLHVDSINLPHFIDSFLAQDAVTINHAEILWNAAHDVMAALEEMFYANAQALDEQDPSTCRKLESLRSLRHATRVLCLEETLPTEESWDWNKLLEDLDALLMRIDPERPSKREGGASSSRTAHTKLKANGRAANADASTRSQASSQANADANAETHWDALRLKVGDLVGVQVFEKRNKAQVLKIARNLELVQVHYVDWSSIYDEFLPVSSLFHRGATRTSKRLQYRSAPAVHEGVLAQWGKSGQLYNAIVLKVIRSNACLVHYLKFEKDWDQWILPGHIFKKYSAKHDQEPKHGNPKQRQRREQEQDDA